MNIRPRKTILLIATAVVFAGGLFWNGSDKIDDGLLSITVITAAAIFALRWFFESKHQPPGQPLQDPAAQSTRQQQQRDPLLRLPRRNSAAERSPRNAFVCRSTDISARKPK
jgi:hypothetical protein